MTKYDDLSVTITWSNGFEAPIARGMPYTTVLYNNLTPVMKFGHAILSFDGRKHIAQESGFPSKNKAKQAVATKLCIDSALHKWLQEKHSSTTF